MTVQTVNFALIVLFNLGWFVVAGVMVKMLVFGETVGV